MTENLRVSENGNPNVAAFREYGSLYGFVLGAIAGVLIAGPHFHEWSFIASLLTIFGGGALIGLLFHVAIALAYSSQAVGNTGVGGGSSSGNDSGGEGGGDA